MSTQAYRMLYEDGICIVDDFFDPPNHTPDREDPNYPDELFSCSAAQSQFVTRANVGREIIFDGVLRSTVSCGYDTYIDASKTTAKKKVAGPAPRQQLKHSKVVPLPIVFKPT
jgi:hypothetical protein